MTKEEIKLRRRIKAGQTLYDMSNTEMATRMHLTLGQWERRLANPGKITYLELMKIEKILKMDLLNQGV